MKGKNFLYFVIGLVTGGVGVYFAINKTVKDHYQKVYEIDIEESKAFYQRKVDEINERLKEVADKNIIEKGSNVIEYASRHENNDVDDDQIDSEEIEEYNDIVDNYIERGSGEPYVIAPDEYGENPDYEQIELTLYSDGVLTDDENDIIYNVEEIIGTSALNTFGEYEDDAVYVRNDKFRCEYAILKDYRSYSEVMSKMPMSRRPREFN